MRRLRPAATLHRRRSSLGREFPNAYLSPLGTPGRIFVCVKIWLIPQAFRHQGATSFAPGSGVVLPRLVLIIFTGARQLLPLRHVRSPTVTLGQARAANTCLAP
jgi:hypothetical protein